MTKKRDISARTIVKKMTKRILMEQSWEIEGNPVFNTQTYVTDLYGKQHLVCKHKIETVRKSMEYWKDKQQTERGKKFYTNMKYLYRQILLFMEGNRATT